MHLDPESSIGEGVETGKLSLITSCVEEIKKSKLKEGWCLWKERYVHEIEHSLRHKFDLYQGLEGYNL